MESKALLFVVQSHTAFFRDDNTAHGENTIISNHETVL